MFVFYFLKYKYLTVFETVPVYSPIFSIVGQQTSGSDIRIRVSRNLNVRILIRNSDSFLKLNQLRSGAGEGPGGEGRGWAEDTAGHEVGWAAPTPCLRGSGPTLPSLLPGRPTPVHKVIYITNIRPFLVVGRPSPVHKVLYTCMSVSGLPYSLPDLLQCQALPTPWQTYSST